MKELIALAWFALSLFGCDVGGTSIVNRVSGEGGSMRSEAYVKSTTARFRCVESSSGQCSYRLLPADCADGCQAPPLREFVLDEGQALVIAGLPPFRVDAEPAAPR